MQIEVLRSVSIEADLRDQLEQHPPKLEQLYEQLYQALAAKRDITGQLIIDNVFKWLLCAQRRLKPAELIIAVAMNLPISPSAVTKEKILDLCRNFVVFDEGSDVFRFAHLSVQEFLEKKPDFLWPTTHAFAAEACLVSVLVNSGCDGAQQFLNRDCNVNTEGKLKSPGGTDLHAFHEYARSLWHWHFREAEEANAATGSLEKISRFFLFPNTIHKSPMEIWLKSYFRTRECIDSKLLRLADIIDRQSKPIAKSLLLACVLDLGQIVMSCLKDKDISDEIKNQCLEIAVDHLDEGKGNVLKLLLTESSNLLSSGETLRKLVRSCARAKISTNLFTVLLDLLPAGTFTEDLIAEAIDQYPGGGPHAKVVAILLDRAGEFLITQNLLDRAVSKTWGHHGLIELLLGRPRSARVTEKTLVAAVSSRPGLSQSTLIARLLDLAETNAITPSVLVSAVRESSHETSIVEQILRRTIVTEEVVQAAASGGSLQVMTLILEHGGAKHVSSETIDAAVHSGNVELVAMLLDRGGDVTQDLVQEAASGWRSMKVLKTLLDRGGIMTQPIFEAAASACNLETFTLLLEKGGRLTDAVLQATLENYMFGAKIMEVLLDRDPPFVTAKDVPQLLERAMETNCMAYEDGIRLAERLLALMPDQDISATILTSVIRHRYPSIDFMNLFFRGTRRLHITESLLVTALEQTTASDEFFFASALEHSICRDVVITLFKRAENITIGTPILKLAAANDDHGDEILTYLLSRWRDVRVTEAVFEAAAGNLLCGKEALLLLEAHSGRIINTQTVAKAAVCKGSLPATRLLLVRPRDWSVTEELVMCATRNEKTSKEMVELLVNEFPGTITHSLIFEAARDKRCRDAGLRAFLGPTKINKIPEDLLLTIFKHQNSCSERGHTAKIEVLLQACSSVEITDSVFEAITMALDSSYERTYTPSKLLQLFLERCKLPPLNERMLKAAINSEDAVALLEILMVDHKQEIRISKEAVTSAALYGKVELLQFFAASGLWTQPIDEWIDTANRMAKEIVKLERAAARGDQAKVWDLVLAGVAADRPGKYGATPLLSATGRGHESVVSILLTVGAQPDRASDNGTTPLHIAAERGHWKVVETLLNSGKVSMDANMYDNTPLSMAVKHGHVGVVRLLEDYIERQRRNSEQKAREP